MLEGLGIDAQDLNAIRMALRTVLIYAATLVIVRVGSRRVLSQAAAFDAIVAIMSRAINGSAPFPPTLAAGIILAGLHGLIAAIAYSCDRFGTLLKRPYQCHSPQVRAARAQCDGPRWSPDRADRAALIVSKLSSGYWP